MTSGSARSSPARRWSSAATFTSARVAALPLEGRACLAEWDDRDGQLVLHVSTQVPHQVRSAVAQALQLPERAVRVIAPDVGGGFGLKCVVGREEVAVAAAALRLRRPVRWIEDRQENLAASFHGHEQRYRVRAAFDSRGRFLALDADIDCDVGAYSAYPFTCAVEPLMAASELPGVYKVPAYRARGRAIATNKAPTAPYRGVSRPQLVLVMERLMEKAARALHTDPLELRRLNMIGPGEFPYTGVNGITYDEGSYRESLDLAERRVRRRRLARGAGRAARRGAAGRDRLRLLLRAHRLRHAHHVAAADADDPRLRHGAGADGPDRRGHRHHRHLRPRPGARDDVRADRRRPARRAPGAGSGCARATPTSPPTAGGRSPAARS